MVWCKNRYLLIVDLNCQNSNWQIFIAFSATKDSVQNHRIVQKIWSNNWSNTRFWGIRICVMTIRLSKMPAKFCLEEGRGSVKALLIYSLKLQRFVETIDIFEKIFKIRRWFNLSSIFASCRKCTELQYQRSSWSSWSSCTLLWRQSESR